MTGLGRSLLRASPCAYTVARGRLFPQRPRPGIVAWLRMCGLTAPVAMQCRLSFRQQRCRDGGWAAFGMIDPRGYCANGTASGMLFTRRNSARAAWSGFGLVISATSSPSQMVARVCIPMSMPMTGPGSRAGLRSAERHEPVAGLLLDVRAGCLDRPFGTPGHGLGCHRRRGHLDRQDLDFQHRYCIDGRHSPACCSTPPVRGPHRRCVRLPAGRNGCW